MCKRASKISPRFLLSTLGFLSACTAPSEPVIATETFNRESACQLTEAVESSDGIRRFALIVGISDYKNPNVPDLRGAAADAQRFYELLTGKNGYSFPKQNVCLLLDEQATTENFKLKFSQFLIDRIQSEDVGVVYYAGHGSRVRDDNNDEPDGWDETFLFHDARSQGVHDFRDDELNALLAELHHKTNHISVFLDSCNSGTATRAYDRFTARFFDPPDDAETAENTQSGGDGNSEWVPDNFPGMVVFTAASDGTPALERDGRGVFTDQIIKVFGQGTDKPLTYAKAARQIMPLVSAESYQIPYFQGNLEQQVFGNLNHERPVSWDVVQAGSKVVLSGPPMLGAGVGAELRIYASGTTGTDSRNPEKSKATVVIDQMTGLNASGQVTARRSGSEAIDIGDIAVLARPADAYLKLKVTLRPEIDRGGITQARIEEFNQALARDFDAQSVIQFVNKAGDFEVSSHPEGGFLVKGPENQVRNHLGSVDGVVRILWQHARQKALLQLQGEGGDEFTDQQSLQVQVVPQKVQDSCATGEWQQAEPNSEQVIPLCHSWNIKVTRLERGESFSPKMLIGGVILSTDGGSFGFPFDGRNVALGPGESYVFNAPDETFQGQPPLDVNDHIIVFGTKETNPVPWHLLTASIDSYRGADLPDRGLYRALSQYLVPGSRGVGRKQRPADETTWTLSSLSIRTEANSRFRANAAGDKAPPSDTREFTIKNFDIRPYLPDMESSGLYKLLNKADWLAQASVDGGFSYKQHAWTQGSDLENLKLGIDSSRAIWFAFTRSGLRYNRDDRYLTSAEMVEADSVMADEFERCDNNPDLQLGDILVYRDEIQGDGHVVLVIDPKKRIAWGSHGFDGNAKALRMPLNTGVEYQLIRNNADWERWDRKNITKKACWRYRAFVESVPRLRGSLGVKALQQSCSPKQCGL